ncbi:hypothetical protein SV7mr_26520 [Stieleria bergensis]|uniref:Uncharacterized protein n=1 Tax=Stieleria bergensis TaxID=2528025 RepID=A0A517SVI0_9BACT|nr:hypothetical protein SV7mr_26520 [Planctomycetes bacterium SV_7m_r]
MKFTVVLLAIVVVCPYCCAREELTETERVCQQRHTQHHRRVRKVDVSKIDFTTLRQPIVIPLDRERAQDIEDRTPSR